MNEVKELINGAHLIGTWTGNSTPGLLALLDGPPSGPLEVWVSPEAMSVRLEASCAGTCLRPETYYRRLHSALIQPHRSGRGWIGVANTSSWQRWHGRWRPSREEEIHAPPLEVTFHAHWDEPERPGTIVGTYESHGLEGEQGIAGIFTLTHWRAPESSAEESSGSWCAVM